MRIPHLYIDAPLAADAEFPLPGHAAGHALRVLRLHAGDAITLFNGDGCEYAARLIVANAREATARIESRQITARESTFRITLAQSLARGEKMDWVVQKAVELGVAAVVPLITERSEVKLDAQRAAKRTEHWRTVAIAACEQSGRCVIPAVTAPLPLQAWAASLDTDCDGMRLMLHPGDGIPIRALQPTPVAAILAVGPEGGFGNRDLAALRDAGFRGIGLGPRILRTETAGLAAIAALQALYGDI